MSAAAHDFLNPDVIRIFAERAERVRRLREKPKLLELLKAYYREHPADFINDFGITFDPRVASEDRGVIMPFILFPRQRELINWMVDRWRNSEPGIVVKSRDVGASWLAMALGCTFCVLYDNFMVGVGSAKETKLDRTGDPDTLFYKGRQFVAALPVEFRAGWTVENHAPYLRLLFPETNSSITGEAGDSIGRGGRKSIYILDESAHIERPQLVDASLAATSDCRIDMSSVNGMANSFAEKAHGGKIKRFDFTWRDDPRKDDAWYAQKKIDLDPITLAQEIDCSFTASAEGVLIPSEWAQAAIDAHIKLKLKPSGLQSGSFDIADEGRDRCAFGVRHGNMLTFLESWTGKGSNLFESALRVFRLCDEQKITRFNYDADGMGASVRGDVERINVDRKSISLPQVTVVQYWGSGAVLKPEAKAEGSDRTNGDLYENFKAQSYFSLRHRFQATWRALQGQPFKPDDIISISSSVPEKSRLLIELSQPQYGQAKSGKLLIKKAPDGALSPNLADVCCMLFAPQKAKMLISAKLLEQPAGRSVIR